MNLVGTIIGGGTLSLPWAFRQSGVLIGLIVLGLSAISCDVSIYFLLSAARRSGGMRTYDEVVDAAFGRPGKLMALWSVVLTCFFSIVAYGVLLRGLISPLLARYVIGHSLSDGESIIAGSASLLVMLPFTFFRSLNSLRHVSLMQVRPCTTSQCSSFDGENSGGGGVRRVCVVGGSSGGAI